MKKNELEKLARKEAGPMKNWLSKYERDAFIKGFIKGAMAQPKKATT